MIVKRASITASMCLLLIIFTATAFAAKPEVNLKTDKTEYIEGEELNITLTPLQDCNVLLLYVTASGETIRIVPSGTGINGKVVGGKEYRTPAAGENRGLYISEPFGKERIILYASFAELPTLAGEEIGDGLYLIPGGEKEADRLLPDASKTIWKLETFSKGERGRFRKSAPLAPIDMTGSAGRDVKVKKDTPE
ncbi:DUF4384 domain-containing protein [Maridesulfovibrio sp.]|uniref:DUF4384 domain-containing protein n=1 Tax=Maridesulfovibrio sp. TaxID=2795000 RepID=UPI002A18CFA5|nr:DUF4384 domain-containing protein [Maridesulfovibrio sp.]